MRGTLVLIRTGTAAHRLSKRSEHARPALALPSTMCDSGASITEGRAFVNSATRLGGSDFLKSGSGNPDSRRASASNGRAQPLAVRTRRNRQPSAETRRPEGDGVLVGAGRPRPSGGVRCRSQSACRRIQNCWDVVSNRDNRNAVSAVTRRSPRTTLLRRFADMPSRLSASACWRPRDFRNSSSSISPGEMARPNRPGPLMTVFDSDIVGIAILPTKSHPVLIADPNSVLFGPVTAQQFQAIAGRDSQIVEPSRRRSGPEDPARGHGLACVSGICNCFHTGRPLAQEKSGGSIGLQLGRPSSK